MKQILSIAFILLTASSFGQMTDKFEPFNRSDYPKEKYQITSDSFLIKNILIEIYQVRPLNTNLHDNLFTYCRAWLTVKKDNKEIYQRLFKSIQPVGACHGLFIPLEQPRNDYFILSKLGDYDGRIFIIDSIGNVTEKLGGEFYVSKDKRYLFSNYYSDGSGLTVYDLTKGICLFSQTIDPYLGEWYFQDNKYVNQFNNLAFDLVTNKLVPSKFKSENLKSENKLPSYNDKEHRRFCNCGLELLPGH
jgi:hypothetical protein